MLHTAVVRTALFNNSKYTVDLVLAMYLVQLFLTTQQLKEMSFSSKTLKFYWRKSRIRRKNKETTSSYRQKALMQTTKVPFCLQRLQHNVFQFAGFEYLCN